MWCFAIFSKTPWPPIHNALPSISVLTLGLKFADIVGPTHEPCAPLIGQVLRFAQFPTLSKNPHQGYMVYSKIIVSILGPS